MSRTTTEKNGGRDAKARAKRAELVGRIADVLLAEGVAYAPLRDLAARLGTSDRMLLYYFADKADLVAASIAEVSARLNAAAAPSQAAGRLSPGALLTETAVLLTSPAMTPFMSIWADIVGRGGRGEEPFKTIARELVLASTASLEARLDVEDPALRRQTASAILALVEGVWMLDVAAPGAMEGVVELLSRGFARVARS